MVEHLIVPVDGSEESWSAFEIALALARSSNARIDIVQSRAARSSSGQPASKRNRFSTSASSSSKAVARFASSASRRRPMT